MNYESAHYVELDPRDSDLQWLPDAADASGSNLSMLSTFAGLLVILALAGYGVVALVRSLL